MEQRPPQSSARSPKGEEMAQKTPRGRVLFIWLSFSGGYVAGRVTGDVWLGGGGGCFLPPDVHLSQE